MWQIFDRYSETTPKKRRMVITLLNPIRKSRSLNPLEMLRDISACACAVKHSQHIDKNLPINFVS